MALIAHSSLGSSNKERVHAAEKTCLDLKNQSGMCGLDGGFICRHWESLTSSAWARLSNALEMQPQ